MPQTSQQINVLKRFSRLLDSNVKLLLYKSFIICHFNYCPAVWHACGVSNTKKLENIQFRALKFVFNDHTSSYESLLKRADMPSLEVACMRNIACEVYKAHFKLSPSFMCDMFKENLPSHNYDLRGKSLRQDHRRTKTYGLHSFNHIGISIWNSLPADLRLCDNFKTFKAQLKNWSGPTCRCAFCK